jgi:hypothetical protein
VDTARARRRAAVASWLVTMAMAGAALIILIATRETPVPTSWGFRGASEAFGIVCGTVGAIVAIRRPDNLNGWLFCAIGLLFALAALINEYLIAGVLVVPGGLPLTPLLGWLLAWLWVPPLAIAVIFLPLYFPDGRLPSPRWRRVVAFSVVAVVAFATAIAVQPGPIQQATFLDNPLGLTSLDMATYGALILAPASVLLGIAIVLAFASLVVRFRRATGDARQQLKWFALAVMIAGTAFAMSLWVTLITLSATTVKALEVLVIVALMGVPTAAGLAILRYRLYDIDRIVSRTIAYAVISAMLVGAYAVAILVLQGPLGNLFGGDTISVALSTLVVAALFQPVRRRVQRVVDRRFDRARIDAERTTTAFAERLRDEVDIETLTNDLDRTVRATMHPSLIRLWLRDG